MDAAPHPCPWPECQELTTNRRGCADHRPARGAANRGYDVQWQKLSHSILIRRPRCARCPSLATLVDHKIPLRAGGARLDPRNLQPLCGRCHWLKILAENAESWDLSRPW
jgi:5-methylcytosine-specific restriction protein A